jgi:hypothetical protein
MAMQVTQVTMENATMAMQVTQVAEVTKVTWSQLARRSLLFASTSLMLAIGRSWAIQTVKNYISSFIHTSFLIVSLKRIDCNY